jgi:pimeloyl-ACP methyl ester carboxylesterase
VPRAVLGGNSLGGDIAWRVAALAPQRVSGWCWWTPPARPSSPVSVPLGLLLCALPVLGTLAEHILPRALVRAGPDQRVGRPRPVTGELVDRYYELTLREGNRQALGLRLRQLEMGAGAERIATLRLPTLILWGRRDRLVPLSVGQAFQQAIPAASWWCSTGWDTCRTKKTRPPPCPCCAPSWA